MSLVRYEANPIAALFDEMEHLWGTDLAGRELAGGMYPKVDIVEHGAGYTIKVDLPGLAKEDIKLSMEDGVLTVSGERKLEVEKKEENSYYHFERSHGKFSRAFSLPDNVDGQNIEARYTNGVLEVTLRKTEEAKPKAIDIKVD